MDASDVIAGGSVVVAGIGALFAYKSSGKANDVSEKANELGWVKELRQDAIDTRREMDACQVQVTQLRRQLAVVTREAEHWVSEFQFIHRTVWRPGVTVERLREMLGPPPPENGDGPATPS